jgi:hypothetical protein
MLPWVSKVLKNYALNKVDMSGQPQIARGLGILETLQGHPASLEELAAAQALPVGLLRVPVNFLLSQNLVTRTGNRFAVADSPTTRALARLSAQWRGYNDTTYRTLAQDVAEIILNNSWPALGVSDVLLFGSTLRETGTPNDIDMVIVHNSNNSHRLAEFNADPYGQRPRRTTVTELRAGGNNDRHTAQHTFYQLGYLHSEAKRVGDLISKRVGQSLRAKADEETMRLLFDVHVLHIGLFGYENNSGRIVRSTYDLHTSARCEAIASCRDPTFWHTVLTTGRLYDRVTHDFTQPVSEKYPGTIGLFVVEK